MGGRTQKGTEGAERTKAWHRGSKGWPRRLAGEGGSAWLARGRRFGGRAGGAASRGWRDGQEGGGQFFVEGEKVFDALAVGVEGFGAVAFFDGAIQFGVGFEQFGRHGEGIVKVGEGGHSARGQVRFAGGEDGVA